MFFISWSFWTSEHEGTISAWEFTLEKFARLHKEQMLEDAAKGLTKTTRGHVRTSSWTGYFHGVPAESVDRVCFKAAREEGALRYEEQPEMNVEVTLNVTGLQPFNQQGKKQDVTRGNLQTTRHQNFSNSKKSTLIAASLIAPGKTFSFLTTFGHIDPSLVALVYSGQPIAFQYLYTRVNHH